MGNSHGKPVVFTDQGEWASLGVGFADPFPIDLCPLRSLLNNGRCSELESLSTVAGGRKGSFWQSADRGAQGYRLHVCAQVHSER
jgi:hypothetical protein